MADFVLKRVSVRELKKQRKRLFKLEGDMLMGNVKQKKYIRYIFLGLALILLALMIKSVGVNRCFKADDTKNWYRKRIALYLLPSLLFVVISFFRNKIHFTIKNGALLRTCFMVVAIVLGTCAFQRITCEIPHRPNYYMDWDFALITLSITAAIFMFFWLLIWDIRIAAVCGYWFLWIAGYGYYCVALFRGEPFHPMDIFSFGTALSVAGNYDYPLVTTQLFWLAWGGVLTAAATLVPATQKRTRWGMAGKTVWLALTAAWISILLNTSFLAKCEITMSAWADVIPGLNRRQGTLTTLMFEATQLYQQKPAHYNAAKIGEDYPQFLKNETDEEEENRPNVIVIMNESMADLSQLWKVEATKDPFEFMHNLKENTIYGNTYVPVHGGSTCTTEFCFLTGTPTVPSLNIPYMSIIQNDTPSIAWQLKKQGYTTVAFHPYHAQNYRRDEAYPLLGFDRFLSLPDVSSPKWLRGYISDQGCYDKIWELYQNKDQDERLFVFNVTMQNHSPYGVIESVEIKPTIKLTDDNAVTGESWVEIYLSCMEQSDKAFSNLISKFENEEEPTIILMFGDHQPFFTVHHYGEREGLTDLEKRLKDFITPFVIWANFPIEERYMESISVHYLAAVLMEQTGLPMTPYDEWLLQAAEEYPVVHLLGYADAEGAFTAWETAKTLPETIRLQHSLRYNRLNDHRNRLPGMSSLMQLP